MASGGPPLSQPGHPVTSPTDCSQCRSFCLGPIALPCGHVICRRCLHDVLHQLSPRAVCQRCSEPLDFPNDGAMTISEFAQQMGTDPVTERMVRQELDNSTDKRCLNCPNKKAANVCLDCQEYYCDACSATHCRSYLGKDHILHPLLQVVKNASSEAHVKDAPTASPGSPSALSTSSLDSIHHIPNTQPCDKPINAKVWEEWVRKEMDLLEQASSEKVKTKTTLQDILTLGQKLLKRVSADGKVIDDYLHYLPHFDVVQRRDSDAYIIRARGSDTNTLVRMGSFGKRLSDIRHCQWPEWSMLDRIKSDFEELLQYTGL